MNQLEANHLRIQAYRFRNTTLNHLEDTMGLSYFGLLTLLDLVI